MRVNIDVSKQKMKLDECITNQLILLDATDGPLLLDFCGLLLQLPLHHMPFNFIQ